MTLNAGELQVPGSHLYTNGDTCEGKPGHVYVMTWSSPQEPAADGVLQNGQSSGQDTCNPDCDEGVLLENDQLVTIAFLPAAPNNGTLSVLQPSSSVVSRLTTLVVRGKHDHDSAGGPTVPTTPRLRCPPHPVEQHDGQGHTTTTAGDHDDDGAHHHDYQEGERGKPPPSR